MWRYLGRRLLGTIPLVLGVATVVFFLINLLPGDPLNNWIVPGMSPEALERWRQIMGLDQPLYLRYVRWMSALFQGDLGYSFKSGTTVASAIGVALPKTLFLSLVALVLSFAVGILIGVIQAVRQYSLLDSTLSVVSLTFYSMPSFWLAIMMMLVFSFHASTAGWPIAFPVSGDMNMALFDPTPWEAFKDRLMHLVLPATTLMLVLAAGIARYMRGSMLEVIRQDYVRTARAKGLSEFIVIFKHALRNALIPIVTLFGLYLPVLFSGTVFVETVFAWPGMGRLLVGSILERDYPIVMGVTIIFALVVIIGNLIADLLYAAVDPRIRYD